MNPRPMAPPDFGPVDPGVDAASTRLGLLQRLFERGFLDAALSVGAMGALEQDGLLIIERQTP